MSKIDLADGYYRVPLSADAALSLAVLIPSDTRDTAPLEAFPLVLPMGWAHSPPYFCAFTETIADITNSALRTSIPSHPLLPDTQCTTEPTAPQFYPTAIILGSDDTPPLQFSDVYIDDFMLLAQKPHHMPLMHNLLTAIDMVFHDPVNSNCWQVVSASKLLKGDATFSTFKRLLGWDVNTHTMTLALPEHRLLSLTDLIQETLKKRRSSRTAWQHLLGTLRSTSPALYGARHLFSTLQHAFTDQHGRRIRLTNLIHATL